MNRAIPNVSVRAFWMGVLRRWRAGYTPIVIAANASCAQPVNYICSDVTKQGIKAATVV